MTTASLLANGHIVSKSITPGSRLIVFLIFLAPFFGGCEYFNRPLQPFIEKHAAEVSVESVGFRFASGSGLTSVFQSGKYVADPGVTPVIIHAVISLDNPANLALEFSLSWTASDSGMTAALSGTGNRRVEILVTGAQKGKQIELRLNAKAETNRAFRFFVPIVFNSLLTVNVSPPTGNGTPVAHWVMLTPANHPGIVKAVISYRYWNGTALVPVREEYGWDESLSAGAGGLTTGGAPVSAGRSFSNTDGNCAINFPASISTANGPGSSATTGYYCFFRVEIYDRFGLSAGAETKGFSAVNANGSAKTGGVTYPTLNAAIEAAVTGNSGNPTEIELLANIEFPETNVGADSIAIAKYIKLTVPQNQTKTIKRTGNNSGAFFNVSSSAASLTLAGNGAGRLILDGGAVWTGGTRNPLPSPSPVYGAANSGITATGAFVNGGTLTIADGAVLQNNQNTTTSNTSAGAVYISSGTFTMSGGIIKNNENAYSTYTAGAIYMYGSTLNISGGEISGNNRGAAIELNDATLNFSGGEIKNNGGVIGLSNSPTVNMSGGAIKDNADRIYIDSGHFNMSGGGISGSDSANPVRGHAIDINVWGDALTRSISMSGSAHIASNNVVVTHDSWPLQISGDLAGTAPVATIQPMEYTVGHQVLAGNLSPANIAKFAVKPVGSQRYTIDSDGKLQQN